MHSLAWLASNGTASIVCFPGILYRTGAEQKIRKYLIDNNFIDCIIQLPENLFFGTSIATCIMVLKKNKIDNSTLFIDASKECVKVTNNNRLTNENIENILKIFKNREDVQYVARLVSNKEIEENNYNLSVSTYVEKEDTREVIDIKELNKQLDEIVKRENILRDEISKIIAEIELDELIQELCSDGVEYKKLGEIVEYQRGKSITKKNVIEGEIPVISGGQQPAYYHNESNREGKTITIAGSGAYAGYIMYWEKPIFVSDAFSLKGDEININTKYIYYYLKKIQEKIYSLRKGAGISHVYFRDMQDFLVPVPPLEVQCELVHILDKFTLLTAELTARRKQYEYYRDKLLTFKEKK